MLGVLVFGTLVFGWPLGRRLRKGRAVRTRAASRIDRFATSTPADEQARALPHGAPLAWRESSAAGEGRETAPAAWQESSRLRRLATQLTSQEQLVADIGRQLDGEAEPLRRLLDRQAGSIERVMANLGRRLEPVREFASGEESILRSLQEQMKSDGMSFVAHAFSEIVEQQHERIEATRARIDRQREPFERFVTDEQATIELALKHFDSDLDALERALTEQRKVTVRLLDAMRSDDFTEVKEYLLARQQVLDEIAKTEHTDPSEIASRLQAVRNEEQPDAPPDSRLAEVLDHAARADARLMAAGSGSVMRVVPSAAAQDAQDPEGEEAPPESEAEDEAENDEPRAAA